MTWGQEEYIDVVQLYACRRSRATMCESLCDLYRLFLQTQGETVPSALQTGAYTDFLESEFENSHYFGLLVQRKMDGQSIKLVGSVSAEIDISGDAIPVVTRLDLYTNRAVAPISQQRTEYLMHRLLLYALRLEHYEYSGTTRAIELRSVNGSQSYTFFFDKERHQFQLRGRNEW